MIRPRNFYHFIHLTLLISLAFLVYGNTLHAPFVFDDLPNIRNNQSIAIKHLDFQELRQAALAKPSSHRPVANISFALNYYFGGYSLPAFHLTNIIIHILTGLILYGVIFLTLRITETRLTATAGNLPNCHSRLAFFGTAIWLVNPVNTQAVTYTVQRMASLAALFYILSLFLFILARSTRKQRLSICYMVSSLTFGMLAIGSKENAVFLPFSLLLYEFIFFQGGLISKAKGLRPYLIAILFFFIIVATIYLGDEFWRKILDGYSTRDFNINQRVLTQFRVVFFYLSQFVWPDPSRLNLDHDFLISQSLFEPWTTILAIVTLCGILLVSFCKADRHKIISFSILWFFLNLIMESSVIPLEIIFEHRVYLPSMFLGLLVVCFCGDIFYRPKVQLFFTVIILLFSFWSYQRNEVWRNELTLWSDVVAKSPDKARGYNELGMYYFERRQPQKAIPFFRHTLLLDSEQAISHNNLGLSLQATDKTDLAIKEFKEAIRIIPDHGMFHINLGIAYMQKGSVGMSRYELVLGRKLRSNLHKKLH